MANKAQSRRGARQKKKYEVRFEITKRNKARRAAARLRKAESPGALRRKSMFLDRKARKRAEKARAKIARKIREEDALRALETAVSSDAAVMMAAAAMTGAAVSA